MWESKWLRDTLQRNRSKLSGAAIVTGLGLLVLVILPAKALVVLAAIALIGLGCAAVR